MEIRQLIELGNTKKGSQAELAKSLGTSTSVLAAVKGGRQGLPDYACFALAEILEIEPSMIIAASALVTEKNEERRKIFYPFVHSRSLPLHLITKDLNYMTESTAAVRATAKGKNLVKTPPVETRASNKANTSSKVQKDQVETTEALP